MPRLLAREILIYKRPAAQGGWRRYRITLYTIAGLPLWWRKVWTWLP